MRNIKCQHCSYSEPSPVLLSSSAISSRDFILTQVYTHHIFFKVIALVYKDQRNFGKISFFILYLTVKTFYGKWHSRNTVNYIKMNAISHSVANFVSSLITFRRIDLVKSFTTASSLASCSLTTPCYKKGDNVAPLLSPGLGLALPEHAASLILCHAI